MKIKKLLMMLICSMVMVCAPCTMAFAAPEQTTEETVIEVVEETTEQYTADVPGKEAMSIGEILKGCVVIAAIVAVILVGLLIYNKKKNEENSENGL